MMILHCNFRVINFWICNSKIDTLFSLIVGNASEIKYFQKSFIKFQRIYFDRETKNLVKELI